MDDKWNPASNLPSPGIPLLIKTQDSRVIEGIRPDYILDRHQHDQGFRDMKGNRIDGVKGWVIK